MPGKLAHPLTQRFLEEYQTTYQVTTDAHATISAKMEHDSQPVCQRGPARKVSTCEALHQVFVFSSHISPEKLMPRQSFQMPLGPAKPRVPEGPSMLSRVAEILSSPAGPPLELVPVQGMWVRTSAHLEFMNQSNGSETNRGGGGYEHITASSGITGEQGFKGTPASLAWHENQKSNNLTRRGTTVLRSCVCLWKKRNQPRK